MDRNLYAPPAAEVADAVKARKKRPREVTWAIILIWGWLVMEGADTLLSSILELVNTSFEIVGILLLVVLPAAVPVIIVAWINSRIGAGRRWARILAGVLLGASEVYTLKQSHFFPLQGKIAFVSTSQLISLLLAMITLSLLFAPRANHWFGAKGAADS